MTCRHKFSFGKKFWSWKFSTINNDIFGKFSVPGNFSWVEMCLSRYKRMKWGNKWAVWRYANSFSSKVQVYFLSCKLCFEVFMHQIWILQKRAHHFKRLKTYRCSWDRKRLSLFVKQECWLGDYFAVYFGSIMRRVQRNSSRSRPGFWRNL